MSVPLLIDDALTRTAPFLPSAPKQIDQSHPLGLTPESLAREFEALGRGLANLSASEYDGLSATGLARIADMASRCRRNVELLREECGR